MDRTGVKNPNYRHGKTCYPSYCSCGRVKDFRALQCAPCAGKLNLVDHDLAVSVLGQSESLSEAARKLGISRHKVTDIAREHCVDLSHMRAAKGRAKSPEDYLVKTNKKQHSLIRKLVLQHELIDYVCARCSLEPVWCGQELTLDLHHKDGDPTNNVLENLEFLCPNCHSQTPTHKGKARKRA